MCFQHFFFIWDEKLMNMLFEQSALGEPIDNTCGSYIDDNLELSIKLLPKINE